MRPLALWSSTICAVTALACSKGADTTRAPLPEPPPPLVATAPTTMDALCLEGEVHSWEVLGGDGEVLALTQGRCSKEKEASAPAPWRVDCQLRQDDKARYEVSTWLDDQGRPVAAQLRDGYSTRYYSWDEARIVETHLGDTRVLSYEGQSSPTWMLPSHALYLREIMLRVGTGHDGEGLHQFSYAPDRDALSELHIVPVRDDDDASQAFADLSGAVLAFDGAEGKLGDLTIRSLSTGEGIEVYRQCEAPEEIFQSVLPERPQPSYRLGAGLETLAIDVPASGESPALGAELVRVASDEAGRRQPAVLFISGAGSQDRLGFVPEQGIDVGSHEIHDTLARAGLAVLRYDDRVVGQSKLGLDATPGFEAAVDDARRAWQALASHPEIDPTRITLMGHGEGALVASILAQERIEIGRKKHRAERLVMLAAPGRNLRELIYDEIRRTHADRQPAEVEFVVQEAKRIHEAAIADEDLPASAEPLRDWMQEVFAIEPIAELRKVKVPVLALQGGKDFQVSAERDFGPLQQELEARKDASRAVVFAELDHLFKYERGESRPGHYRDLSRHVDDKLLQTLVTWLVSSPK